MKKSFLILILLLSSVLLAQTMLPNGKKVHNHNQMGDNEQRLSKKALMEVISYGSPPFNNPNYYYAAVKTAPTSVWYRQAGLSPNGQKIVAQKSYTDGASRVEVVLMNADGSGEAIISPGNSGVGDIVQYGNPFWSDDGLAIGYVEEHAANPNKVVRYVVASEVRTFIYEPVGTLSVNNADFLGSSTTSIVFWDNPPSGSGFADLFTWDGTTRTNITSSATYKEYEPVSNAAGDKIVYWSGETDAETVNTTHTLTYSGGAWAKDVGFTPIGDSWWGYWTSPAANQIALTMVSTGDISIYNNTGTLVTDLSGPGYSGGGGQWNFFGSMPQGLNGEYVITSNAGRGATPGRDIIIATPRTNLYVNASTGNDSFPGSEYAPFATIGKAVSEAIAGGTVYVAAGAYGEIVTVNKALTITGTGSPSTTKFILTANPVTITGFNVSTIDVSGSGKIQDAVNGVNATGTVNVAAGTYAETVTVDKALTLTGTPTCHVTKFILTAQPITISGFDVNTVIDVGAGGSIQDAIDGAAPGGTININIPGTYSALIINKPVNLVGGTGVIINSGSPAMTVSSTGVTITGFTFNFAAADYAIDVLAGLYNVTIINCDFRNTNGGVGNGVRNQGTGTVDARRNYWNSASGPTIASNPSGTGNVAANISSGTLIYFPWWTDLAHTTLPVLALSSPVNGLTGVSVLPTSTWELMGGAVSYKLYVDDADDGWGTPLYAVNQGSNLTKTFDATITNFPLTNGTMYYWKVAALDVDGNEYPSSTYHFTTTPDPSITLSQPSGTIYSSPATFSWYSSGSTSGLKFIVQYKNSIATPASAEDEAFWSGAPEFTSLASTTSLTTTGTVLYGKTYRWRVLVQRTSNNEYVYYPMANVYNTFTTAGGSSVTVYPSWPTGNATVYTNSPTLYWYLDQYATGLKYQVKYSISSTDANADGELDSGTKLPLDANLLAQGSSNLYLTLPSLPPGTLHYWQVRAYYQAGDLDASPGNPTTGTGGWSAWSSIESFTTNGGGTPVDPIPSYPTGGVTVYTTAPYLYWYLPTAATGLRYTIELTEDPTHPNGTDNGDFYSTVVTDQLYRQISGLTPGKTYNWKVRSYNASTPAQTSGWSSEESFVVAGGTTASYAVASYPIGNPTVYTNRPTLYWYLEGSSLGITGYTVKYKKASSDTWLTFNPGAPDATDGVYSSLSTSTFSKTIDVDLTYGATYYWAVYADGTTSFNSLGEGSFTVVGGSSGASVVLSSPSDGSTVYSTSVTLYWYLDGSSAGLQSYTLMYSQSDVFASPTTVTGITTQYKTLTGLTNGATYYWKVLAVFNNGSTSYTSPWSFTVNTGSPSIVQPLVGGPNNVTVNTASPMLSWVLPAPTAANTTYELQLAENPNFQSAKIFSSAKSNMVVSGLEGGKSYFWKVRSKDGTGNTSYYSGTGQFKVNNSVTAVEDKEVIPTQFELSQNYPNPFNPTTKITYALPQNSYVSIKVYDMLGREVKALINNEMSAGNHSVDWNGDDNNSFKVASGTYIYRITAGNFVAVKKMILIK